jgi:hypothetical protein
MTRWIWRLILSRRLWLMIGLPVSAVIALCTVASVSLSPLAVRGGGLGFAVAKSELYVGPPGALATTNLADVPALFIQQAIALAAQTPSPEMRDLIAMKAGIPPRQLAIDGPLDLNISVFQNQPDGEKRSTQILVQNAPYRVGIVEDLVLPEIAVTAQAPDPAQAARLASATGEALSSYLNGIQDASRTPVRQRLEVSPLGPASVTDGAKKGVINVAVLTFLLTFAVWSGVVVAVTAIVRDLRRLRLGGPLGRASL